MAEITINLRADPSQYESGVKAAEKATQEWEDSAGDSADEVARKLEEVIRTLVKLGTESGKTRDDMVTDLRKFGLSAEQAERAVDAVWDEMKAGSSSTRDVEKAADAYDDVEKSADHASDAAKKVGDEAKTTGGKFSELGDIARDVLEGDFAGAAESAIGSLSAIGAFAGVGGALAGLMAAGGAAIIGDWIGQWGDAAEATKERISGMYQDMVESGEIWLSAAFVQAETFDIINEKGDRYAKAAKLQKDANVDLATAIAAVAGSAQAQADIQGKLNAIVAANTAEADKQSTAWLKQQQELNGLDTATKHALETMSGLTGEFTEAQGNAALYTDAMNAAGTSSETTAGKIDGVSLALKSMPAGKTVVIDADTSAYFAQIETIRRQKISKTVGIDYVINERRGTQVQ